MYSSALKIAKVRSGWAQRCAIIMIALVILRGSDMQLAAGETMLSVTEGPTKMGALNISSESTVPRNDLQIRFGPTGLSSLIYKGTNLLVQSPTSLSVITRTADGKSASARRLKDRSKTIRGQTITWTYDGLVAIAALHRDRDSLRMEVTFRNIGQNAVEQVIFRPFTLQFPQRPLGDR